MLPTKAINALDSREAQTSWSHPHVIVSFIIFFLLHVILDARLYLSLMRQTHARYQLGIKIFPREKNTCREVYNAIILEVV